MKFKVKSLQKPTVTAAAFLLGANVVLDVTTGHREGVVALARVATYVALGLLSAPLWAWVIGRKIPLFYTAYKALAGVVRKTLTAPTTQVVVGGWVAIGWTGALASNAWSFVRPGGRWMAPLDVFTGDAFATGGGVLGGIALAAIVTIAMILMKKRAKNRPDKNDVHNTGLEKLLAPSISEVAHLLCEPGSLQEVTRPFLGDALVRRERLHGIFTTYCLVPLFLSDAASGIGVFCPTGLGKGANTVGNTVFRPGGQRTRYDDGHGLGYIGPQILVSNTAEITTSIKWRVAVARAALRQRHDGAEPTHEQIRELVTVYDPTGVCRTHPDLAPFRKGWDPLEVVTDRATAQRLAEGLLTTELNSNTPNAAYFAKHAVRILTAFLLAAHRAGLPLSQTADWSDEIQHDPTVATQLATILAGPNGDREDKAAYEKFNATFMRLRNGGDGERSAVWGTVAGALEPFTSVAVQASTNPAYNEAMVDAAAAVTTPYSMLYVIMPINPTELDSMRPVYLAFMENLLDAAVREATRNNPARPALALPLLWTLDEFESTRCMPKLPENLASVRKYNIRIQWLTQTFSGLSAVFSDAQMGGVIGNSGAILTYAGYSGHDDHLKHIVEEIGARTVTKISKSKRGGESAGESESKDRVQLVDVARLSSELHADKMLLQLTGASAGTAAGEVQLRPFIVRQRRVVASKTELKFGWFVDPVTNARLERGTAEGVVAHDRPSDRRWVRPAQRLYRSLAARTRQPRSEPDTA